MTSSLTIRMAMVNDSGEYVCNATSPLYAPVSSDPALVLIQSMIMRAEYHNYTLVYRDTVHSMLVLY